MKRGAGLEAALKARHQGPRGYRDLGLADVKKTSAPAEIVGGKLRFTEKGPPDFMGYLAPIGRGVCFDAKSSEQQWWKFDKLEDHQARDLESAMQRGALSFLYVRTVHVEFVVTWAALQEDWWAWRAGYRKGARAALPGLDHMQNRCFVVNEQDWLAVFREIGEVT